MIDWLDEFYGDSFKESLMALLGPLFTEYAAELWAVEGAAGPLPADFVDALAAAYAEHHRNSSRIQLQEVVAGAQGVALVDAIRSRFDEWSAKRPEKVAANETRRTANALAIERMKGEGVVTKVWAASGQTCPYCSQLNGTAVEIEKPFFTPEDSFQPEGADTPLTFTTTIGHPPVHQGCDCSVVPG